MRIPGIIIASAMAVFAQACTQFPPIAEGTTTSTEFADHIAKTFPVGSEASQMRAEVERQGSKIFASPSFTRFQFEAAFQ